MSLLGRIFTWLPGRREPVAPPAFDVASAIADDSTDSSVVLQVPSNDDSTAADGSAKPSADDREAWFVPRGEPVSYAPRALDREPIDSALHTAIVAVVREPDLELPRLPQVAQQTLALLARPDFSVRQLAGLIEQDPMLAAAVLRMANSALYRGVSEITRLEPAFARIGQRSLRGIVLSENVKALAIRVTSGGERSLGHELWQRSIASATIAARFADRVKMSEDEAFLTGLLHDIGMLAVLRIVHDYQKAHGRRVSRTLFDVLCEEWHEHLGLRLADAWNLPTPLTELIAGHHKAPAPDDPLRGQRYLLQFTDMVTAMLEYAPYVPYDFFNMPCVAAMGLRDDAATRAMLMELPAVIEGRMDLG
ncbi:MAG: HDOD domain-containing protein [Phycisphaerae bacterium]